MRTQTLRVRSMLRDLASVIALVLVTFSWSAWGRQMQVVTSAPAAEAVIQGRNMQYAVHFDGPVDHVQSRLEILRDGHVVQSLHLLLDSAPNALFASAPAPEPGHYALHWTVKSIADQETSEGMIPFSVAP